MTKEAILHKHVKFFNHKGEVAAEGIDTLTPESAIYKAMDEYAKQIAIEFADWTQKNYWEKDDDGYWYKWMLRSKIEDPSYTTAQLFQQFLKDKNKP